MRLPFTSLFSFLLETKKKDKKKTVVLVKLSTYYVTSNFACKFNNVGHDFHVKKNRYLIKKSRTMENSGGGTDFADRAVMLISIFININIKKI